LVLLLRPGCQPASESYCIRLRTPVSESYCIRLTTPAAHIVLARRRVCRPRCHSRSPPVESWSMSATWGARRAASGTMPRTRSKAGACNLLVGAGALTPTPQRPSLHHVNTAVKDARPLLARPCPRRRQSCRIWSRTMLIRRSKMRPPSSRIPECLYSLVTHCRRPRTRAAVPCDISTSTYISS